MSWIRKPEPRSPASLFFRFTRADSKPAQPSQDGDDCAHAESPPPTEVGAEPRCDHGRQEADAVAAGVHDGGGSAAALASEADGRRPKRGFAKPEHSQGNGETADDPEALRGEEAAA